MKVVLISTTPPPVGGISRWTARMLNIKLNNGWEIVLVDDKPINRESFGDGIKYKLIDEIKRAFRVCSDLRKALKDKDVKVVHTCPIASLPSLVSTILYSTISHLYGKKIIAHFRCTVPNMIHSRIQVICLKWACKSVDYLILLNSQTKEYIDKISKTTSEVVPNFVDSSLSKTDKRISPAIKSVLYVGGVTEEKGCCDLISIAKCFPEIDFKLAGRAETKVKEIGNGLANVHFLGVLNAERVKEELESADVFAFLSKYPGEGFSNALVEAMSYGLPCIVTDWAANADMIENKGGFVIPINNPTLGRQKLEDLKDPIIREKMSKWNIHKVKESYTATSVTNKYVEIYEHLI